MKTYRINKRYFVDAKNVRDAYRIYKKEIIKDAISMDETRKLCELIRSTLHVKCDTDEPGFIDCELYNGDAKKIKQYLASKGYKAKSDGEMGFYISK